MKGKLTKIMNSELVFEYKQSPQPEIPDLVVCKVKTQHGSFISLGLKNGQKLLSPEEVIWFELHGDLVVQTVKELSEATGEARRSKFRNWDNLMKRFVKDCNIIDS